MKKITIRAVGPGMNRIPGGFFPRAPWLPALLLSLAVLAPQACSSAPDLSPATWADDYDRFMAAQLVDRSEAGVAMGKRGAVTVAYNGLAARAGLEALKQGGGAIDAALTAALTQVALTAGAPISYFGILSLVYYDAGAGTVHTMNAEWNTVLGEDDAGGVALVEAQRLATAAGLVDDGHWTESADALRKALGVTRNFMLDFLPPETLTALFCADFTPGQRVTPEHAKTF